jgi:hypothetical protein
MKKNLSEGTSQMTRHREKLKNFTLTLPTAVPTLSSKDLKAVEDLTSPNFFAKLSPNPPKRDDVFSVTPERVSAVF